MLGRRRLGKAARASKSPAAVEDPTGSDRKLEPDGPKITGRAAKTQRSAAVDADAIRYLNDPGRLACQPPVQMPGTSS